VVIHTKYTKRRLNGSKPLTGPRPGGSEHVGQRYAPPRVDGLPAWRIDHINVHTHGELTAPGTAKPFMHHPVYLLSESLYREYTGVRGNDFATGGYDCL
jgi:hypothetical protein